ncbi:hypothetical protein [Amycolatopsis sp. NBC_01480]|uniref:hypothetical protein n=1 Tax=Amycolatopsis sp. NBC_01480 TaxID=2903562 RepID=UPI002E2BD6F2|nr:hypothetical protein [Amycolatopsis sp. NBC_01480]
MQGRVWVGSVFAVVTAFVVVQATYLLIIGTQLIEPAIWDLSIATLILSGVTTISLSAQDRIVRALTRRIDLAERRAIIQLAAEDSDDPRQSLRVVR